MVQLVAADIETTEVLEWRGTHLFHYAMSSCSQKTRIVLNLKEVDWTPHVVDLGAHENHRERFLGVNPRGLVPVLVIDGAVHIESNDIIALLDDRFPAPALFPAAHREAIAAMLREEDALHLDLRTLSFRFVHGRRVSSKPPEALEAYRGGGTGTVQGRPDPGKAVQIAFYERIAREGLSDEACRRAASNFRARYSRIDAALSERPYLLGAAPTVVDVAWFVYTYRLHLGGYPLARLHPNVDVWFARLCDQPAWVREVAPPEPLRSKIQAVRESDREARRTMVDVVGLR